jgi:hypothetical protein
MLEGVLINELVNPTTSLGRHVAILGDVGAFYPAYLNCHLSENKPSGSVFSLISVK